MKECITLDFVSNFQIVKLLGSGSGANVKITTIIRFIKFVLKQIINSMQLKCLINYRLKKIIH